MADWEEIKRLAADFQRTQTSDTLQRISERNCIDIVKKLTDLNLIELIYTCDGKEFITPSHLVKEIEDEVYANGGRVHLHDLAANLNVDYQHVENKAKELAREKSDEYDLILGQIIHSAYKKTLMKQIHETMLAFGQLSIADFAKSLDLPSDFLLKIAKELMPKVMDDFVTSPDERTYYTTDMMDRYKSIIAGTLTAISRPTTIASIMKKIDIPERLFTPIVEGLVKEGRIDATIENRAFIPSIYAREQNEWVDKFYSANSYVEYDMLLRRDIKQPKAFLKKRFPQGVQLKTCFISPNLVLQVESLVEDCIASNSLIDISTILPACMQPEDIEQVLSDILKRNKQFKTSCFVLNQTSICSLGFIATFKQSLSSMMPTKAQDHLKQGVLLNYFLGAKMKISSKQQKDKSESENKDEDTEEKKQPEQDKQAQEHKDPSVSVVSENDQQTRSIELSREDLKRDKRNKKSKANQEQQESDEEQSAKKSKSKKSAGGSGGGSQGREIKTKSVKKKYLASGNKGKANYESDEETGQSTAKTPKSNRGRAARRGASPVERQSGGGLASGKGSDRSKASQSRVSETEKERLIFMETSEIIERLRKESRDLGDFPDEVLASIACQIEDDLNKSYEKLARETMDEHLRATKESESCDDGDVDLVE